MEPDKTYVLILKDSLTNKIHVLGNLINLTEEQGRLVKENDPDIDKFEELLDAKDKQIDMINMLDEGFDNIYAKVRDSINENPSAYKEELQEIKELIEKAVELGARLETMEYSNKESMELFFRSKKSEVRSFKTSKNISDSYSRNMPNQHMAGDSYFMNQKK